MSKSEAGTGTRDSVSTDCLVQAVTEVMIEEPLLEVVKINQQDRSISVATLGRPDSAGLEETLKNRIAGLQQIQTHRISDEPRCTLLRDGTDCSACEYPQQPVISKSFTVSHAPGVTTVARVTCPTAPTFWKWRAFALPKIVPREVTLPDDEDHEHEWREQMVAAVLCGVFGLIGAFAPLGQWNKAAYVCALISGAWFIVHEVWERLQHRVLDVHFLMLAVAAGSVSIGAWGEGVLLLFLFSLSGALEHFAMGRTHREIKSLFKSAPKTATQLDATGQESTVEVETLTRGMRIRVKPGEQFPVDAEVTAGKTACDESNLTGEATPVEKNIGDTVLAGTLNLWGAVDAAVLRPAGQSALQKIIRLIREAQHLKSPSQRFTDRFGSNYTYAILGLSFGMFLVWWLGLHNAPLVSDGPNKSAFYRAMTLLVVASPCALVLSIPSAILAAIAWAARRGILFRGGAAVEKLAEIEIVALDKTGTLTTGELKVAGIESFPPGHETEIAQLAYSLEILSTHPLARAIVRHGKQIRLPALKVENFKSQAGLGLQGTINGSDVTLGNRAWITQVHDALSQRMEESGGNAGTSEVWITSGDLLGRVMLKDDVRPEARQLIAQLNELGLKSVVLTGDRKESAEKLTRELPVHEFRSQLTPENKVAAIREFTTSGHKIAMVGDGVNDAPSLAAADVGVAMGARGSDAALEQAEVVLMHDRLENFLTAFRLSQRARKVIHQNLAISLGTVVVLVVCALFSAIPLTIGVLGHEGSTVVVVMNSLRLLIGRDSSQSS